MLRLALLVLTVAVGCSRDEGITCDPPATTQYTCAPIPAGSYGCVGGPVWLEHYSGPEHHEDPDQVFPAGCTAEITECGCCYPGGRKFFCTGYSAPYDAGTDAQRPAMWSELL